MVLAPNGKSVQLSKDGFVDIVLLHRQKVSDEELVNKFPQLFIPCSVSDEPIVEKTEEIEEVVTSEEKQMLTEVPKLEDVKPEDDKPVVEPRTTVELEDDPIINEGINEDDYTKKQLIEIAEERKIELPKYANKKDIIEILNKG